MSENVEQVEIVWASNVNGRVRGEREVVARTPDLENLVEQRHVRVVRTVGAPPELVPDPDPDVQPEDVQPATSPRRATKAKTDAGGEG